ncbi:response regulator [Nannocystis pusilla]|uniref:Response regulator n=1 Tax=Nannocystis pusilla TaxID=889268 RepID=A0A9X3IU55_9BACT|nr:response regulator [Nannocystis pusilla]MCY1004737.1 response regulator [Nannocystis pusilla]
MSEKSYQPVRGDILVVDDTLVNLRILTEMLAAQGYKVRPVTSGLQALQAAAAAAPDLVLLDINMPGMTGYEVCQQLKAQADTRDVPVIFMSARDEVLDKIRAFEVGGVDYVTKPFHLEELLARVATHVSLRALQRQLEDARLLAEAPPRRSPTRSGAATTCSTACCRRASPTPSARAAASSATTIRRSRCCSATSSTTRGRPATTRRSRCSSCSAGSTPASTR